MRVPLSWLSEFVKIKDIPEVLSEKLQFAGTKVEAIDKIGDETIFVTEVTSNRPDCLSIYGTAREVAAITNEELALPHWRLTDIKETSKSLKIHVADPTLCPVYSSIILDNISIKPSPSWLVKRLAQVGVRSINNVVDITNYVMFEYGQPLHAFDYDKIHGATMTIRASKKGEKLTTLDGIERILPRDAIVIEDDEKLIDLAGIVGGQISEVDENTGTVFLHVSIDDPVRIRQTSKFLGLRSEASTRNEKKLDLLGTRLAMTRATLLLMELSGASIASEVYEFNHADYKSPTLILKARDISQFVGIAIPPETIERILTSLEFSPKIVKVRDDFELSVIPPSFRRDVTIAQDVIEEIVRIYGYNKLPLTLPEGKIPTHPDTFERDVTEDIKNIAVGLGFTEVYGSTLTGGDVLKASGFDPEMSLAVLHPMSRDYAFMRPSLIPGLLTMLKENLYHVDNVSLFEVGSVFQPKNIDLPGQPEWLSMATTVGSFRKFKGKIERLLAELGIEASFSPRGRKVPPYLGKMQSASIGNFGSIGLVNQLVLGNFGVRKQVWAVELDIDKLRKNAVLDKPYPPVHMFPPIYEDVTIVVKENTYAGPIMEAIARMGPLVKQVSLINEFENTKTFRITYQHLKRTLSSDEVGKIREKIINHIEKKHDVSVKRRTS